MPGKSRRQKVRGVTLKTLKSQLARRQLKRFYVLFGEEPLLHDEAIQSLRSAFLQPEEEAFDLDLLHGDELDVAELAARVATYPLMAETRVVVVRKAEKLKGLERVFTTDEPGGGASVLVLDYSPSDDPERRRNPPPAGLAGTKVELNPPEGGEEQRLSWAQSWATEQCARKGVNLSADAAEALVLAVGPSLADLHNEIEKLMLFVEEEHTVGMGEVEAVVGRRLRDNVYKLAESILREERAEAARIAEVLALSRGEHERLIALVGSDLLRLMKLKAGLEAGIPRGRLWEALRIGSKWRGLWEERAREVSWEWLWSMAQRLYTADTKIKQGRIDLRRAIDLLIATASPVEAPPASR
jgi:DNA polymerase-3 subunit delta